MLPAAAVGAGAAGPGPAASGSVQVDETFIGGDEPGLRGGRAPGKKVLTGIAVEAGDAEGDRPLPDGGAGRRLG